MFRVRNLVLAVIVTVVSGFSSVNAQQQQILLYSLSPGDLMYSEIEGGYVPAEFEVSCWILNKYDTLITDVRLELFCDDSTHLSPVDPQSFVFIIDTLQGSSQGGGTFQADWTVRYSSTAKRLDSLIFWFRVSFIDPYSGMQIDSMSRTTTTMLVDWFKPYLKILPGKNFYVPHLGKVTCSGYDPPVVPATFYTQNTYKYRIPIDSLRIQIPDGWAFAQGYAASVPIYDTLAYLDSIRYTWGLIPPIHPTIWEHEFKATVVYPGSFVQTIPTTMRTIGITEQLRLTTTLPNLHIVYDSLSGKYTNLPLDMAAILTAWGRDFGEVVVEAELVNGAWMYLELDESRPGMERRKTAGPLAMCDSVDLHWQAKMIKENNTGRPYEGAVQYRVFNADSSVYSEYTQKIIIDAVHQTGVPRAPAAEALRLSAFPNPFSGSATISYSLPARSYVSLNVYDMMGRLVRTLDEGMIDAGEYSRPIPAEALAPGVYNATLRSGAAVKSVQILRY